MKAAPRKSPKLPVILNRLQLIQELCGPVVFAAAMKEARERMDLTAHAVSLLIELEANPYAIIGQGDDAELRGVKADTLRDYKDQGLFPRFINGSEPVKGGKAAA